MPRTAPKVDYGPIRDEYVASDISIRALARKSGVSFGTLAERARKEGWLALRQAAGRAVAARSFESMMDQIAEQERAIKLESIAVARATIHRYAELLKAKEIRPGPRDAATMINVLQSLIGGGTGAPSDSPTGEPINVTPVDAEDPEFWRQLVDTARTRVAASGGVGPTAISGAPSTRPN